MSDWADKIQQKILRDAGVLHLESLKARIGTSIGDELRNARAAALEEAAKVAEFTIAYDTYKRWPLTDVNPQDVAAAIRALAAGLRPAVIPKENL